jgi:hypothetical protein
MTNMTIFSSNIAIFCSFLNFIGASFAVTGPDASRSGAARVLRRPAHAFCSSSSANNTDRRFVRPAFGRWAPALAAVLIVACFATADATRTLTGRVDARRPGARGRPNVTQEDGALPDTPIHFPFLAAFSAAVHVDGFLTTHLFAGQRGTFKRQTTVDTVAAKRPTTPTGPTRPTRPTGPTGGKKIWGTSGVQATKGDGPCVPNTTNAGAGRRAKVSFAACDPDFHLFNKVPKFTDDVVTEDGAEESGVGNTNAPVGISTLLHDPADLARGDWETTPEGLKPFKIWFQQPKLGEPCVTKKIRSTIEGSTFFPDGIEQQYHWYVLTQKLGFVKLFPAGGGQCGGDNSLCDEKGRCLKDGEVPIWGYDGRTPGTLLRVITDLKFRQEAGDPTIIAPVTIVRQANALPPDCAGGALTGGSLNVDCKGAITSTHHHGMTSLAGFDGWADDVIRSGQHKDYVYPNDNGPRTNWYHDHGLRNTGFNVGNGLAGMYILHVPPDAEAGSYGERILPRWDDSVCKVETQEPGNLAGSKGAGTKCFELMFQLGEGRWSNEGGETAGIPVKEGTCRGDYQIEGNIWKTDVITVNGLPWPKIKVFGDRLYRLRVLDASITRSYRLRLTGGGGCAKMLVIGTDTELLQTPVQVTTFDINVAERYQVVVDFRSCSSGDVITLRNANDFLNNEDYRYTGEFLFISVWAIAMMTS